MIVDKPVLKMMACGQERERVCVCVVCLIKMILLEKKRGDERADGSMMNERTSIISEKKRE